MAIVALEETLKEKTAKQIADALVDMLDTNRLSVNEMFRALMGSSIPKALRKTARIGYKGGWIHILRSRPEPNKAQLKEILAIVQAMKNAPYSMRTLLKETVSKLPHPPGGPKRKIKPEQERTVCAEIMQLRAECDNREAVRRVALKYRASERTVYRTWGKYYPKKKKRSGPTT